MEIHFKKKDERAVLRLRQSRGVPYLSFPALEETGLVAHAFSTRLGGVSKGDFATMNFSFTGGTTRMMCWKITAGWRQLSAWRGKRWF